MNPTIKEHHLFVTTGVVLEAKNGHLFTLNSINDAKKIFENNYKFKNKVVFKLAVFRTHVKIVEPFTQPVIGCEVFVNTDIPAKGLFRDGESGILINGGHYQVNLYANMRIGLVNKGGFLSQYVGKIIPPGPLSPCRYRGIEGISEHDYYAESNQFKDDVTISLKQPITLDCVCEWMRRTEGTQLYTDVCKMIESFCK